MKTDQDIEALEAARRAKAEQTRIAAPTSQLADEWSAIFHRMQAATKERVAALHAWAKDQPQTRICDTHKTVRKIDWEKSERESYTTQKHVLVYTPCPICEKYRDIIAKSEWLVQRGVPKNLTHASFDNFRAEDQSHAQALDASRKFARAKRGFLILLGEPGNGKSHLAVGIMRQTVMGRFITNAQMLAAVRARYNDRTLPDPIPALQKEPLLIFDELGVSDGGVDEAPKLHQIFVERYNQLLPTVITGNLTRQQLEQSLGQRVYDRMREACFAISVLKGESQRKNRRDEYFRGAE